MKVRVIKSTGSWYEVLCPDGSTLSVRLKGKFKLDDVNTTNPIAVGDWVDIEKEEGGQDFVISEMYQRHNYIIRKSPRQKNADHIIASNLDQAFLIATVDKPRTSTGFIDRFLLTAEAYHIPAHLVFNKQDVLSEKALDKQEEMCMDYMQAGYPVHLISCEKQKGLTELKALMKDKTTLLCGHSGVGKSSLINLLIPGIQLRTDEISAKHNKGIHTTTFAEMFALPFGGFLIDTPGIKEFGISGMAPEEIGQYFIEFRPFLSKCRFANCTHYNEPNCAVKMAVEDGSVSEERYKNYLQILEDLLANYKHWEK